jgi:plasmid stabilization system protein ParE
MKRRKVAWTTAARRDLEGIVLFLAERSETAALGVLDRIEARARTLDAFADRGRVVPELDRLHVKEYRELVVTPYRVVYRISGQRVLVLAVLDARRSLEDILLDRLLRVEG